MFMVLIITDNLYSGAAIIRNVFGILSTISKKYRSRNVYPCKRKRTCRKYNFAISPMKPQESKPTEIMRGYRDKIFVLLTIFIAIIFVGLNYCARKTNSSLSPLES